MTSTFDDMLTMIKQKSDPYSYIASFFPAIYWLDLLYMEMWIKDEIKALKDLPMKTKLLYWHHVQVIDSNKKWLRIVACRAFLAYDSINNKKMKNHEKERIKKCNI